MEEDNILEMNVGVVVELVLCLHKQDASEVNATQYQGATCLREIQFQERMDIYTVKLSVIHVIVMKCFLINTHIKKRKQLILQWLGLC